MTEGAGMRLGFCQFCGAPKIFPGQGHCAACGQKLLQASEIVTAAATGPAAPATGPAAPVPPPAFFPLPEQPSTVAPWAGAPTYPALAPAPRRNRAPVPLLIGIGLVAVVALAGGIYVVTSSKSTPGPASSNPAVAAGSIVGTQPPTVAPTVAVEVTPQAATGTLTGGLLAASTTSPVSGVGVILCLKSATGCTVDAGLQATTSASGQFEIDAIPPGSYVVLYSPAGAPGSGVDGLKVDIDDQSATCIAAGFFGSATASCEGSIPLLSSDSGLKLLPHSQIHLAGSGMSLDSGGLYSPKLGLCLNFQDGSPVSVDITAGSTATVQITNLKTD